MKALCNFCKKEYEELHEKDFIFIENGCPMICYECNKKLIWDFENKMNHQPDSSKREDSIDIHEWHKRCAFGPYADAVLGTRQ